MFGIDAQREDAATIVTSQAATAKGNVVDGVASVVAAPSDPSHRAGQKR